MEKINFLIVKESFEKLSKGDKAELRRVASLTDIFKQGVSYRLLPKGERPSKQWERVLFFIPFGNHIIDGKRLGELFALLEIKNDKLQQMLKSTYPNDLLLLRDLLKWIDNKGSLRLNYQYLAEALYFWGAGYKSSIEKDYFYTKRLIENGDVQPIKELIAILRDPDKEFEGVDIPKLVIDNIPTSYVNDSDANKANVNDSIPVTLNDKKEAAQAKTSKSKPKAKTKAEPKTEAAIKGKAKTKPKINDDGNDLSNDKSDNNVVAQVDIEPTIVADIEPKEPKDLLESNFIEIGINNNTSKTPSKASNKTKSNKANQIDKQSKPNISNNETSTKTKLIKRNKDIKE